MSVPSMQPAPGSSSSYFHQPREKKNEVERCIQNNSSFAKTVTIDRGHYEHLLRISQQFENIKRSLLAGGVSRENFDVLANDSAASLSPAQTRASSSSASTAAAAEYPFPKSGPFLSGPGFSHAVRDKEEDRENGFHASSRHENPENSNSEGVDEEEEDDDEREKSKPDTEEIEQRTLEIRNLPDRTTHLDLTNAIRGGALLEIYLRYMDNSARVTFADPAAAQQFYERARRVGFVVGSRRTEVTWSDRQFFVRPYIKQNLSHGASRNLVIHNTNPNITAKLIRDHLEHIHNLVVLDVRFDYAQAVAYIHTNSVHNAMFARSCMRSRAAYRGMRIEFAGDECARGWYQGDHHDTNINTDTNSNTMVTIMKKTSSLERGLRQRQGVALSSSSMPTNRFEMLTVEEYESGSETETDGD